MHASPGRSGAGRRSGETTAWDPRGGETGTRCECAAREAATCEGTRCDARAADMRRTDMRRSDMRGPDMPGSDMRATEGTETASPGR